MNKPRSMSAKPLWAACLFAVVTGSATAFAHGDTASANPPQATGASNDAATATNPTQPNRFYGHGPGMVPGCSAHGAMPGYGSGMKDHGLGPGEMMPGYGMMRGHRSGAMMPGYSTGMHSRSTNDEGQPAYLHLSPEQRQAWAKQWQESAGREQKLHDQVYRRMTRMHYIMAQPSAAPEAVGQAFDQVTAAQKKLLMERMRARQQFAAILTPQQRKAWYQAGPSCPNGAYHSQAQGQ